MSNSQHSDVTSCHDPVQKLWEQWRNSGQVSFRQYLEHAGDLPLSQLKSVIHVDQQERWRHGERLPLESYLRAHTEVLADDDAVMELICGEILLREERGETPDLEEYTRRFPKHAERLRGKLSSSAVALPEAAPASELPTGDYLPADPLATREEDMIAAANAPTDPMATRVEDINPATDPLETRIDDPSSPTDPLGTRVIEGSKASEVKTVTATELRHFKRDKKDKDARGKPAVAGYEILDELGRGGMGVVYKARHLQLKRVVALKMILAGAHASDVQLARFRSEAEAVARLQHPNIVQIYEVGEQDGCPYFCLEFIEGGTLSGWLSRPVGEREALTVIEPLARAVHVAHLRGIVHRDLKPGNVLLTPDGTPKLTDFGLAKKIDDEGEGVTRSGAIMGTPSYMSPEQASGKIHEIGPSTDIYALGAILYELLTGRPPFRGTTLLDTLEQLRTLEPAAPRTLQPKVHADVETMCLKCLQKDPKRRYASAEALADDLHRYLIGEPIEARPTPQWERAWKWSKRHPMKVAMGAMIVAAVIAAFGGIIFHNVDMQFQVAKARADVTNAQRGQLRAEVEAVIQNGEVAVAGQKYPEADRLFESAIDKLGDAEDMADLRGRIDELRAEIRPKLLDEEGDRKANAKYEQFKKLHSDAVFHSLLCTGTDAASSLAAAKKSAETALGLFGVSQENPAPPQVDARFLKKAESDILLKCYELLLLMAETVGPLPRSAAPPQQQRAAAERALQVLDAASKVGFPVGKAYHVRRAHYLELLGDAAGSARERAAADRLKGNVALDHFWLGEELFKQGNLTPAMLELENALRLQPDHFWAQYVLAVCQLRQQKPAQAKANLTACLSLRPDFVWIYTLRGFAHGELGEFDAALADFGKALDSNPDAITRYGVYVNRGVTRLRQGNFPEAVADFQRAIEVNPKQFQAHVNLAKAYEKQKDLGGALRELDEAVTLESDNGALYRNRARLQLLRNEDQAALRDFDKAIALEPKDSTAPAVVEDYVERGKIQVRAKDYAAALQSANQALKLQVDYVPARRLRGDALLELKDFQGAIQEFDACLKADKNDLALYQRRAVARAKLGLYPAAIEDYTRALVAEDSYTFAGRGWAYVATNALPLALNDFERAVDLNAENGYAYSGRGYVRVKLGQLRAGLMDAEDAARLGPQSSGLLHNVARSYAQAVGKLDEESKLRSLNAQTLEQRFQYQSSALRWLRQSVDKLPRKEQAAFWNRYVKNDPDLEPIRRSQGFVQLETEMLK